MASWPVQDAKTRFSELIERAQSDGPQVITRHGTERAVVLSAEDYHAMLKTKSSFKEHLLGGPKTKNFMTKRSRDPGRTPEL